MSTYEEGKPHSTGPALGFASLSFEKCEHWVTVGIGLVLICATLLLLGGSLAELWNNLKQWPETSSIFMVVDKLLFVLMLVEILHTVRASIQSHRLEVEPFLIVGLIASVRRMLIVTVEASSSEAANHPREPFDHSMIELGVLGGLILVLIVSIYLARRSQRYLTETPDAV